MKKVKKKKIRNTQIFIKERRKKKDQLGSVRIGKPVREGPNQPFGMVEIAYILK